MATILEDDWIVEYKPLPAPRDGSGFDFGDGSTLIDGHHPDDIKALQEAGEERIWTVVDDGESTAIIPGRHYVNKLGYILTEKKWDSGIDEIVLEDLGDV